MFLDGALPLLIYLNLSLQRSDPIIHILDDLQQDTVTQLLSRFALPKVVIQFKSGEFSEQQMLDAVNDVENYLTQEKCFVGLLARSKFEKLFQGGEISDTQRKKFLTH